MKNLWRGQICDSLETIGGCISTDAATISPSPRFAESAEQNGEWCQAEVRPGVRCFVSPSMLMGWNVLSPLRKPLLFRFTLHFLLQRVGYKLRVNVLFQFTRLCQIVHGKLQEANAHLVRCSLSPMHALRR